MFPCLVLVAEISPCFISFVVYKILQFPTDLKMFYLSCLALNGVYFFVQKLMKFYSAIFRHE